MPDTEHATNHCLKRLWRQRSHAPELVYFSHIFNTCERRKDSYHVCHMRYINDISYNTYVLEPAYVDIDLKHSLAHWTLGDVTVICNLNFEPSLQIISLSNRCEIVILWMAGKLTIGLSELLMSLLILPEQSGHHFADDFFKLIFINVFWLLFVLKGTIDNKVALVQVMAWRRTGDKPLPKPMLTQFADAYMRHQGRWV